MMSWRLLSILLLERLEAWIRSFRIRLVLQCLHTTAWRSTEPSTNMSGLKMEPGPTVDPTPDGDGPLGTRTPTTAPSRWNPKTMDYQTPSLSQPPSSTRSPHYSDPPFSQPGQGSRTLLLTE